METKALNHRIDLRFPEPEQYLSISTAVDLLSAVEELTSWDEQTLECADLLLVVWTARASSRDRDNLDEITDLLRTLHFILEDQLSLQGLGTLPPSYEHRWGALRDVLISRHRGITCSDTTPLATSEIKTQLELRFGLRLSLGRLCGLVSSMELCGLVNISNYKVKALR